MLFILKALFIFTVIALCVRSEQETGYEKPKEGLKKLLSLIYNRYEFGGEHGGQFFLASNNVNQATWELLKMKVALKMVSENSTFLMVFGGSSVTAGHDNYYNQSYPFIFQKRMGDIFESLGIKLIVRDIALGANNCSPYILCYESMGGFNPDFVNWEQVSDRFTPFFILSLLFEQLSFTLNVVPVV
jgi:hypothetical protein